MITNSSKIIHIGAQDYTIMASKMHVYLLSFSFLVAQIICAPDNIETSIKQDTQFSIETSSAEETFINDATEKTVTSTDSPAIPTDAPNYEEADDMEYHGTFENRTIFNDTAPIELPVAHFVEPPPSSLKDETEWMEENDPDAVDVDMPRAQAAVQMSNERSWPWIIAMTALFVAIVLVAFIGILSYKYVTTKYSHRQVLINEEDMVDPNDMKHFTL